MEVLSILPHAGFPGLLDNCLHQKLRHEYMSFRRREVDELFYSKLREGYEIVIEGPTEEPESIAEVG